MKTMTNITQRVADEGTPLVDGNDVTFVWLGDNPPALCAEFNSWGVGETATLLETSPGIWTRTIHDVPLDAYIEYVFMRGWDRVLDPFNIGVVSNGVGGYNNYVYMPEAKPAPLVHRRRGVPKGKVTRYLVENGMAVVGGRREVYLYAPPTTEPTPLVVVWDGRDYLRRVRLPVMVDNLIAQGRIKPIALAMVNHGGQARFMEYCCSEATLRYLGESVLPLARDHLHLVDPAKSPGAFGIMGASLGGLMAMYAGMRAPDIFGHVLAQSPSFILQTLGREMIVWDMVRHGPVLPLKIWMDVGRYEPLLESNQRMADLLHEKGYDLTFRIQNAGHNYPAWRNDVWRGLESLFGPGMTTV